jgi:hypothetical protein
MAFMAPFVTGLTAAATSGAGLMSSIGAAGSLIGTGTAAGVGAGLGMATGSVFAGSTLAKIGTGLSVASSLSAGQSADSAAQYNAQSALIEGQTRELVQRQQSTRQMGAIRASISKSGATTQGTPLMVLAESAANAEIDALNTRFSANREAALSTMRGRDARRASYVSAGASLLTGLSRVI